MKELDFDKGLSFVPIQAESETLLDTTGNGNMCKVEQIVIELQGTTDLTILQPFVHSRSEGQTITIITSDAFFYTIDNVIYRFQNKDGKLEIQKAELQNKQKRAN